MHRQHLHRMASASTGSLFDSILHIPVLGIGLPSARWTGQAEFNTNCRNASAEKHSAGCQDVKQAGETCRNPSSDSIYFYDGRPLLTVLSQPKAQQDPNPYSLILEKSVFTWGQIPARNISRSVREIEYRCALQAGALLPLLVQPLIRPVSSISASIVQYLQSVNSCQIPI